MKKSVAVIAILALMISMASCSSNQYNQGYKDGFIDGYNEAEKNSNEVDSSNFTANSSSSLPLIIIENDICELSLIDAYQSEETYVDYWTEEEKSEQCYVFKFKFYNKHESSNIRIALVDAAVNGFSFSGSSNFHSEDSFSVYTWCGNGQDNTAVDCFKLYFSDIEAATNIRDADKMGNASLSFVFRAYIIDEMDDYGEDSTFTIENAFQYCT